MSLKNRLFAGGFSALAVLSPFLEGAIVEKYKIYMLGLAGIVGLVIFLGLGTSPRYVVWFQRSAIMIISVMITVTALDLVGRVVLVDFLEARPDNRVLERWPRLPTIPRLTANVTYQRTTYGGLPDLVGKPADRQVHDVYFETDSFGFRNSPPLPTEPSLIILGDSFGVASLTTQDRTLTADLQKDGFQVYNLSVSTASPWQEYVNFAAEADRLNIQPMGVVVWLLYSGNDIDGVYGPTDLTQLPWRDPLGQLYVRYQIFRARSPIRQLTSLIQARPRYPVTVRPLVNGQDMLFYDKDATFSNLSLAQVKARGEYPKLADTISAMAKLTKDRHLNLAVIVVPAKNEVYSWVYNQAPPWTSDTSPSGFSQAVGALSQAQGLCFLDLKPDLIRQSQTVYDQSGATLYWTDDTHWNEMGQAVAKDVIRKRFCLDPGSSNFCCNPSS